MNKKNGGVFYPAGMEEVQQMPFTAEELEEMRRADEEIERDFRLTREDLERERAFSREIRLERMLPEKRKAAEYQRSYYEANRDAIAEKQKFIADARKHLGYTQKDVARLLGVSHQAIGHLETGRMVLDKFHKKDELLKLLGGEKECIDAI